MKVTKRATASAKMEKDQEAQRVRWRCTKDLQVGPRCARRQKFCYGKSKFNGLSRWGKILLFFLLLPAVPSLPLPRASSGTRWIESLSRQKTTRGVKKSLYLERIGINTAKGQCEGGVGRKGEVVPSVWASWRCCSMDKLQRSVPRVSGWVKSKVTVITFLWPKKLFKNMTTARGQYPVSVAC